MENTSKALLIAAAVLIAIVLISGAIVTLNSTQEVKEQAQGVGQSIGSATDKATEQLKLTLSSKNWKVSADGETYTSSDGKTVKFGDLFTNDEVLAATGGTKSSYTGNWQVIGVENGKLKLVSVNNIVEKVELGDNSSLSASGGYPIAKGSYKKAITTLNDAAKTGTGISTARSINLEDLYFIIGKENMVSGSTKYGKQYTYTYNEHKNHIFVDENGNETALKKEGDEIIIINTSVNYRMENKETWLSLYDGYYWLANKVVECYTSYAEYGIARVFGHYISKSTKFYSKQESVSSGNGGVRAIVYI